MPRALLQLHMNSPPYSTTDDHDPAPSRALLDAAAVLNQAAPPTLREILAAYKAKGDGDREMLLAMLNAKSAEDQRIAALASLRRTLLQMSQALDEHPIPPVSQYHSVPHPPPIASPRQPISSLKAPPVLPPPPQQHHPQHYPQPQPPRAPMHRVLRIAPPPHTYHSQPHSHGALHTPSSAYGMAPSCIQPARKRARHYYSPSAVSPRIVPAHVYTASPPDDRLARELPPSPYSSAGEREPSVEITASPSDHEFRRNNDYERGSVCGTMAIGTLLSSCSSRDGVDHNREETREDSDREGESWMTARNARHRSEEREEKSRPPKL